MLNWQILNRGKIPHLHTGGLFDKPAPYVVIWSSEIWSELNDFMALQEC